MNTDFKITSGSNLSFWTEVTEPIKFNQLKNDLSCNAVVIGGYCQRQRPTEHTSTQQIGCKAFYLLP